MGRLILNAAVTVDGAFEAPVPSPKGWLVLDPDSQEGSLEKWRAADAMVMGRKTYEGLAAVWPQLAHVPGYEAYARRMNSMRKYVFSRTLSGPLTWEATLLQGDLAESVRRIKEQHQGNLIVTGAGELARNLISQNLVDEFWFSVCPYLWSSGPRIFSELSPIPLQLIATKTFAGGVVQLCYRRAEAATQSHG
jgi:dihydrofolate reductase